MNKVLQPRGLFKTDNHRCVFLGTDLVAMAFIIQAQNEKGIKQNTANL